MGRLKLNIYRKLLILFLLLSLLPLTILGLVSYYFARQALQRNIEHKLEELARLAMERVDQQMAYYTEEIEVWANLEVMQDVLTADADGRINATLTNFKKSHPAYQHIHCLNKTGEIIASSELQMTGKTEAEAEYFKQAVTGKLYISELAYREKNDPYPVIIFSTPIWTIGGHPRVVGALSVSLNWEHIYPLLEGIRVDPRLNKQDIYAHIMLINRKGWVLFAPEFERQSVPILKDNLFSRGILTPDIGQNEPTGCLIQRDEHDQRALIGYAVSTTHGDFPGTDWITLALQNLDYAFAPVYTFRDFFFICFVIMVLTIIVVAHLFTWQLTEPVKSLTSTARCIAQQASEPQGVFTECAISAKTSDEFGELAESFNHMALAIQDRNQRLNASYHELEEYKNKLEEKIEQKVKELKQVQEQIVQQEKLASIGQLAAGVSHELNNPLGGILGFSQYILEKMRQKGLPGSTEEDFAGYMKRLSQMEQAAQRCKTIVENLLKFSRASKTEIKPLDVNQVLEDTLIFTRHQLEMCKVQLEKKLSSDLPRIKGNGHQLQQVFTNIILNAQQAMPDGGRLTISTGAKDGFVEVTFIDSGCGIPKENLPKIFDPFFSTKPVGQGTGLGLSVSYGIVKDLDGDIAVESEAGQGSTFKVRLAADKG